MKIAFDHNRNAGHAPGSQSEEPESSPSIPDWADLRTRLFAAHEVRTALAGETAPVRLRTRGSFAGDAASLLNTYGTASRPVNLDVSTNGKPAGGKEVPVAGTDKPGGRG